MPADHLHVAGLTLQGVSLGGIQTCLMCPELGIMFDVGAQIPGQVKYSTVLVSHGHQDHLGCLLQFVSAHRMQGRKPPRVHVPAAIVAPLRRIFEAWSEIEGAPFAVELAGHEGGSRVDLGRGLEAIALRSVHRVPSLAWLVERTTTRLRPEYTGRSHEELKSLRDQGIAIAAPVTEPVLCVSGDTQIELFLSEPAVRRVRVLVHEVTGWDDQRSVAEVRSWGHTHVDEILAHVEAFTGEALVLVHRSPRHARAEIERIVARRFPASVRDKVHLFGL